MADQLQSIVEKMVAAGESEADIAGVIQHYKAQAPKAAAPVAKADPFESIRNTIQGDSASTLMQRAKDNPAATGASIATMAAGPATAGLKVMGRILGMGAAGVGGALPGAITEGDPLSALKHGAIAAGAQAAGGLAGGALKLAGRGMYRGALLPINQLLGKYGDVVKTGLEHAVPVSKAGVPKAASIRAGRVDAKRAALSEVDDRVSFRSKAIADDAMGQLDDKATSMDISGEGDPSAVFQKRMDVFTSKNPDGVLNPTRLERIKSTLDARNGGAYQKMRKSEPLTAREDARIALTHAASRAQESVVPGYRDMNKGIMDAVGLEKAIQRRTSGSGGNQGLENAMTMLGGLGAVPARLAMLPPVLSRAGIGAHSAGKGLDQATPYLSALIAALGGQE